MTEEEEEEEKDGSLLAQEFFDELIFRLRKPKNLGLKEAQISFESSSRNNLDTIRLGLPPLIFWKYADPESASFQIIWDYLALKISTMTNFKTIKIEPIDSMVEEAWIVLDVELIQKTWERK